MSSAGQPYPTLTTTPDVGEETHRVNITTQRASTLQAIQQPVRAKLDKVSHAMANIVASDLPLVGQVSAHLLTMRGKMFRPTLALLASAVTDGPEPRSIDLAGAGGGSTAMMSSG